MNWRFQTGVIGTIMGLILAVVNSKLQWKIVEIWVEFLDGILKGEVCQSLRNHLHTYISSSTMRKIIVDIDEAVAIVDKGYSEIKRKGCSKNLVGLSAFRRQEEEVLLKDVARKRRANVVHFHIKANEKNKGGVGS